MILAQVKGINVSCLNESQQPKVEEPLQMLGRTEGISLSYDFFQ